MFDLKNFSIRNLFIITVLIYTAAVLLPYAFVTHDGPSHVYNAHIINKLLFSDGSVYEKYHIINPNWVQPNLIGYLLLCFLQLIVPYLWAEKILIAVYVLLFSFGFRFFLKQVSAEADWYSLLIFPFILNAVLFWGFYNFLIGMALSFWFIGLYEKYRMKFGFIRLMQLVFWSLIVYFSHALVFLFCGLYVFVRIVADIIKLRNFKTQTFSHIILSVLVFMPGIILLVIYFFHQKDAPVAYENGYQIFTRLSSLWFAIGSLSFTGYSEGSYLKMLYAILMILSVLKFYYIWKFKQRIVSPSFIIAGFYFLIYLFLPNSVAGGGIILPRLNLMLFLFWIVWLSDQQLLRFSKYLVLAFYLISFPLLLLRWSVIESTSLHCKHILDETELIIPSNSTFITVYNKPIAGYIGNYKVHSYIDLLSKVDNYVAIRNNALTFHNYEAANYSVVSYFPVLWKNPESVEVIWKQLDTDHKLEYCDLIEFEKVWYFKPEFLLSISSLENVEKSKPIWDARNDYSLLKSDTANFLKIYTLRLN